MLLLGKALLIRHQAHLALLPNYPNCITRRKAKSAKTIPRVFFVLFVAKLFPIWQLLTNLPLLGSTRKLAAKDFAPFIKEINWFKFMQYGLATIQTIPKNLKKNLNSKQWTWNFQLLRSKLPFYFCFSQSSKSFSTPFSCLCEIAFFHLQCICHYLRPFFCQLTFFPSLVNVSCLQTICDSCKSSFYKSNTTHIRKNHHQMNFHSKTYSISIQRYI